MASSSSVSQKPLSELTDQEILALTQEIKDSEARQNPLVGKLEPLKNLEKEYERGTQVFQQKIKWLEGKGWKSVRRLRGDGDCFYRAFAYLYVTNLSLHPNLIPLALSHISSLLPLLDQAGFQPMIYEDFYSEFKSLISSSAPTSTTEEHILSKFNEAETSNSIVVFLRLLTSAFLRANEDEYVPFLFSLEDDPKFFGEGPPSMINFCQFYVEAVNKEADHVQIAALTKALKVQVEVAYLDQSGAGGEGEVDFHKFEGEEGKLNFSWEGKALLYRPGHYDCLYK
ncbi:cysteine proteinase [Atractiella rhizophila]|nr:cysteine proteinase [Atractiella rhizophila]